MSVATPRERRCERSDSRAAVRMTARCATWSSVAGTGTRICAWRMASTYALWISRRRAFSRSSEGSFARRNAACNSSRRLFLPPAWDTRYLLLQPYWRSARTRSASRRIARRDRTAVAQRAEVLRRVEAEARGGSERARTRAVPRRAMRLRTVLDDRHVRLAGRRENRRHVGQSAVQMRDDDGAQRSVRNVGESGRRHRERALVDVDVHRNAHRSRGSRASRTSPHSPRSQRRRPPRRPRRATRFRAHRNRSRRRRNARFRSRRRTPARRPAPRRPARRPRCGPRARRRREARSRAARAPAARSFSGTCIGEMLAFRVEKGRELRGRW